ncbi:MAG: helix-turn-helix domain-containing protein [Muribaculaceae bacterium]
MMVKSVHIGQEIAKRINQLGISRSEFARRIGMHQQHIKGLLEKRSLDTEKLSAISEALDFNFFKLYCDGISIDPSRLDVNNDVSGDALCSDNRIELQVRNELLAEKITMLENIIEDKSKIIRLLELKSR